MSRLDPNFQYALDKTKCFIEITCEAMVGKPRRYLSTSIYLFIRNFDGENH